jgi:Ca-activated chloride channel family protein
MDETLTTILNTPFSVIADEAVIIMNNIHFVRADWFYAFIPLILYLVLYSKKSQNNKNWLSVVDPKLLPFVLTKSGGKNRRYPLLLIFIASSLCITALAGPVYKKLPQPVYREQSSLVVLLDLSKSMNATDIRPSRLARAKLELLDILKTRKTGQTALIVYAADAFVVTPLTDDNATIANLVPSLETDMMPAQGSNLSKALAKAFSLFSQAGIIKGDILVVTDGIHSKHEITIEKVLSQGHRLSIFGIGTTEGGPIPLSNSPDGGFLLDSSGAIVIPKLRPTQLQQYALSGSGLYTSLAADDSDINKLTRLFETKDLAESKGGQDVNSDIWQEEGYWLLLPLLLFAALWARKGWIAVLLPFAITFISALPQPAYAVDDIKTSSSTEHHYFDAKHLWSSPDQKAMQAFDAGDNQNAAEQFTHTEWKASALYRNGDYEQAVKTLEQTNTSDGHYNKANALAQLGKYKEAIKSYDEALTLNSNNEDAKYNRERVKQALKEQEKESQKDDSEQDNSDQDSSNEEGSEQDNNEQNDDQENDENQQSESKDQEGDNQESENQQPSDENKSPEQQQAEDKELKQRDADKEKENEQAEQKQHEQDQKDQEQQSDSVENKDTEENDAKEDPQEIEINPMEAPITEEEKATEQWLKRIPDDPGGLLRRKFLYQYKQIPNQTDTDEPW